MHASTPPTEYVPDVHCTSAVFKLFAYIPEPAVVQDAAPTAECFPLAHLVQELDLLAEKYFPAGQSMHVAAFSSENLPGMQGVHWNCAPTDAVPAGQMSQQLWMSTCTGSQSSFEGQLTSKPPIGPEARVVSQLVQLQTQVSPPPTSGVSLP